MMASSTNYALTKLDVFKWGVNVLKYVVAPIAVYVIIQWMNSMPIDIAVIKAAVGGAALDLLHRFMKDNTTVTVPVDVQVPVVEVEVEKE